MGDIHAKSKFDIKFQNFIYFLVFIIDSLSAHNILAFIYLFKYLTNLKSYSVNCIHILLFPNVRKAMPKIKEYSIDF